jgi:hypothetical protein
MSDASEAALAFIRKNREVIQAAAEYVATAAYDSNGKRRENGTWDDDQIVQFIGRARSTMVSNGVPGTVADKAADVIQHKIDRTAKSAVNESLARKAARSGRSF